MWNLKLFGFISLMILAGCKTDKTKTSSTSEKFNNEYSTRFIIDSYDDYRKITVINPWQGAEGKHFEYYITDDTALLPQGIEKSKIIISPVKSIVCTSTTHIAMLDVLDRINLVEGVSGSDFVFNEELRKKIDSGDVYDVGHENGYNTELIYSIDPDIVLVCSVGSESVPAFNRLSEQGITVMYIADYLETHPLARTEWIKVYGELLNRQEEAKKIFREVKNEYKSIVEQIDILYKNKPGVLLGLPFKDKWFVSPGNSYISKLIEDAGGNYLWSELQSNVSVPMSLEAVCSKAVNADIWLNTGTAMTINNIRMTDQRLADLPVLSQGSVFNNNKRLNRYGGNDYWESGTVNPHILLKDIASILNPDLFPGHELVYYTQLKDQANAPDDNR
ncbi:MAG TPA: hypothetical protein DEQ09_04085 [Bacteroidales bacterium]|nr:hypothetical protein [Bacteroidales bacterium]